MFVKRQHALGQYELITYATRHASSNSSSFMQ